MLQQKLLLHLLLVLLQMSAGALGVKVYEVKVPQPGIVGQSARLECLWKTGAKDFYSVRWYMDNEQFYSYIRGNEPEKVNHHLTGINVELDNSDESVVTLSHLTAASEGTYRCELMSEAPKFQTSVASANLTVVNEPEELEIQGVHDRYRTGDTLYATCTARNARPPASLSFYANGKRVLTESDHVTELDVTPGSRPEVYTSTSQLILPLLSQHIPILTITCRSNVLTLEKETAFTTHVEPAGSAMLFFFSTGASCNNPSSQAILMFLIVLLLLL